MFLLYHYLRNKKISLKFARLYNRHQEVHINQKSDFAFGPHQKWCEMLRKNVFSRVVHIISDVLHNAKSKLLLLK